jgi:sialidase-1
VEWTETFRAFDFGWKRIGAGPCHAIQLRSGRLLVPVWLNDEIRKNYRSGAVFSDDGGKTWRAGGLVPPVIEGANECMLFERPDGTVGMNFRSRERRRSMAVSRDGGETWSTPRKLEALPDPICQGSVLALLDKGKSGETILFANPANEQARSRMTLRMSLDGGETWFREKVLHEGPAAYSDLAADRKGNTLCLYERGEKRPYERIWLERVDTVRGKL